MKKAWARTTVRAGVIAAGLLLIAGSGVANAAQLMSGGNSFGANGTQVLSPIQSTVDLCGTRLGLGGPASTACLGNSAAALIGPGGIADMHAHDNAGILNGTQLQLPTQIPVNACGVAVTVLGAANASCVGGSSTAVLAGPQASMHTMGNHGVLNGTQLLAPIQIPINVCGVSVSVLATANATCAGSGALAAEGVPSSRTAVNNGAANGNQFAVPVQIPINVCGNAIAIVSAADATCGAGPTILPATRGASTGTGVLSGLPGAGLLPAVTPVTNLSNGTVTTAGEDDLVADLTSLGNGVLGNGNQLWAPVQVPANTTGNALGLGAGTHAGSLGGAVAAQ
ncbi:chaplin family protein [Actinorhabdospora filicis]|nr:chaplin family protein [Actinorhabdospora filicis]